MLYIKLATFLCIFSKLKRSSSLSSSLLDGCEFSPANELFPCVQRLWCSVHQNTPRIDLVLCKLWGGAFDRLNCVRNTHVIARLSSSSSLSWWSTFLSSKSPSFHLDYTVSNPPITETENLIIWKDWCKTHFSQLLTILTSLIVGKGWLRCILWSH